MRMRNFVSMHISQSSKKCYKISHILDDMQHLWQHHIYSAKLRRNYVGSINSWGCDAQKTIQWGFEQQTSE